MLPNLSLVIYRCTSVSRMVDGYYVADTRMLGVRHPGPTGPELVTTTRRTEEAHKTALSLYYSS